MDHDNYGGLPAPKKITNENLLGQRGINLVEERVLSMGFAWHPTNQAVEAGIDEEEKVPGTFIVRISSRRGVSAMIHHLYVGHFDKAKGVMRLEKRTSDGAPRAVVVRPLDMTIVQELLEEKGAQGRNIPDEWQLGIEDEGIIVCDAYTRSRDAIDFIRKLATKTGCDILYDGMVAFSPEELTLAGDESERRAV